MNPINPIYQYLPFLAIVAPLVLYFGQIKSVVARIFGIFIIKVEFNDKGYTVFNGYLNREFTRYRLGQSDYDGVSEYTTVDKRNVMVGYELPTKFPQIYRKGRTFLCVKNTESEHKSDKLTIYFLRGTFDAEEHYIKALKEFNNGKSVKRSFKIYYKVGMGAKTLIQQGDNSNKPSYGSYISEDNSRYLSNRLLGYTADQIGYRDKNNVNTGYVFCEAAQNVVEECKRWRVSESWYKQRGIPHKRGYMLVGKPGCLSGDTLMHYRRGSRCGGRRITLNDMYMKFNGIKTDSRPWNLDFPTFLHSFDQETGNVFYNRVRSVISSGTKSLMLLTTSGGRKLKLTAEHPVLTKNGYVEASKLNIGDTLIVRGSMKPNPAAIRHGRKKRVVIESLKYYNSGWDKFVVENGVTYRYKRQHRARLVFEAHMNGLSYDDYLYRLKNDKTAVGLKVIDKRFIIHHIDENPLNDVVGNLVLMTKSEHDRLHSDETNFNTEYTVLDTVVSVDICGAEPTYDIQMESPCNNFATADGLLVHNTGKSSLVRKICQIIDVPLFIFDLASLSNAEMIDAWKDVQSYAPCAVVFDDIDRCFDHDKNLAENGGGLTLDCLLGCLSGIMPSEGILAFCTANDPSKLDPALGVVQEGRPSRPGRFDAIIELGQMNEFDRRELAKMIFDGLSADTENAVVKGAGMSAAQFNDYCSGIALALYWEQNNEAVNLPQHPLTLNEPDDMIVHRMRGGNY